MCEDQYFPAHSDSAPYEVVCQRPHHFFLLTHQSQLHLQHQSHINTISSEYKSPFFWKPSHFLVLYRQTIFLKDFFTEGSISRNFSGRYKTPSSSQKSEFSPWLQNEINYFALNLQSETKSWLLRTRRFFISSGKVSVVTAPCKKVCQKNNLSPHGEEIRWFSKKRTSTFPYIHLGPATLFTFSDAIGPSPAP